MRRVLLALVVFMTACPNKPTCETKQANARDLAVDHATECAYDPDAVPNPDCARFDDRAARAYIGAFCSAADLACIESSEELTADCFGAPFEL